MSMKSILASAVLGAAMFVSAGAASASTPIVVDSSFEAPSTQSYIYGPTNVPGAVFTNGAGVQVNNSAWGFSNAPDGVQTAFLQTGDAHNSSIALDVTGLTVGETYSFSFFDSARANYSNQAFTVSFDNTALGSWTPTLTSWQQQTTGTFVATSTSGSLVFLAPGQLTGNRDQDTGIDAITVNSLGAAAVPEPSAWALMLIGLGGMGAALRTRRKALSLA